MIHKKYDIIYSIGRDCACASYLQQNGLRLTSGPFDWLTNAGFEDRFELMLNDFQYFLDKKDLKQMPKPTQFPADKNNDYYENIKNNLYFWHDFSADKSFDEAYPEVKLKYERRIKRFYENIKDKNKVLLVWFSYVHQTPDNIVLELCNRFSDKMGKKIDFLIIEHQEGLNTAKKYMLSKNIERWQCHATKFDEAGVPQTLGNEELIQPIFSLYQLRVPLTTKAKHISLKLFVKFICLFVPIKKWRKSIRKLYED